MLQTLKDLWKWLQWPVALAIVGALFWTNREGLNRFISQEKDWTYLIVAFGLTLLGNALTFVRWHMLVRGLGFEFSMWQAFRLGLTGMALCYVGPGLIGGDTFKAIVIAHGQKSRRIAAAATVFLDRILGFVGLLIMGAIGSACAMELSGPLHASLKFLFYVGAAAGIGGLILLSIPALTHSWLVRLLEHLPFVGKIVKALLEALTLYQSRMWVIFSAVVMASVGHLAVYGACYVCAWGLGGWERGLWSSVYFMPAAEIVGLLPTPGGIGPLEWAIQEAYVKTAPARMSASLAQATGFSVAAAVRLFGILISAVGALLYFASRKEIDTALEQDTPLRADS